MDLSKLTQNKKKTKKVKIYTYNTLIGEMELVGEMELEDFSEVHYDDNGISLHIDGDEYDERTD